MHTNTQNTYACKNATPISKTNTKNKQKKPKKINQNLYLVIIKTKEEMIKTNVWPAIILALNRIAKLKARII
jgi:hypothetical protein